MRISSPQIITLLQISFDVRKVGEWGEGEEVRGGNYHNLHNHKIFVKREHIHKNRARRAGQNSKLNYIHAETPQAEMVSSLRMTPCQCSTKPRFRFLVTRCDLIPS